MHTYKARNAAVCTTFGCKADAQAVVKLRQLSIRNSCRYRFGRAFWQRVAEVMCVVKIDLNRTER